MPFFKQNKNEESGKKMRKSVIYVRGGKLSVYVYGYGEYILFYFFRTCKTCVLCPEGIWLFG